MLKQLQLKVSLVVFLVCCAAFASGVAYATIPIANAQLSTTTTPFHLAVNARGDRLTFHMPTIDVLMLEIRGADGSYHSEGWVIRNGGLPVDDILIDVCGYWAAAATAGTEGILGRTWKLPSYFPCEDEPHESRRTRYRGVD
jgi:hypothetical protein